jgi:spore coat protein CotH
MQKFLTLCLLLTVTHIYSQGLPSEMYLSPDGKILHTGGNAPSGFYEKKIIRDIHLDFPQPNYWALLTSNYESETEIPATMTVDNVIYDSVGVRFRGNTSYFMIGNSPKKSFAVSTDFIHADQVLMGYKNFKFNNAHQDASFMREVLYCQMAARHTLSQKLTISISSSIMKIGESIPISRLLIKHFSRVIS